MFENNCVCFPTLKFINLLQMFWSYWYFVEHTQQEKMLVLP